MPRSVRKKKIKNLIFSGKTKVCFFFFFIKFRHLCKLYNTIKPSNDHPKEASCYRGLASVITVQKHIKTYPKHYFITLCYELLKLVSYSLESMQDDYSSEVLWLLSLNSAKLTLVNLADSRLSEVSANSN